LTVLRCALQAPPSRRSRRLTLALATAVLSAGCAAPGHRTSAQDAHHPQPAWGQAVRERALQTEWRGKSYDKLVEAMGAPLRKMHIPGRDPVLTWAVFYGMRDTRAGCFDAFTIMVVDGKERVVDYFCR
jgi:hypothetical protein